MLPTIDACVYFGWEQQDEVVAHMSRGWREYVGTSGRLPNGGGAVPITPPFPYRNPLGDKLEGVTGTDMAATTKFLEARGVERAVLCHDMARLAPAVNNAYFSAEIARAVNEWTVEHWLETGGRRLYGTILVPLAIPEEAAREIRRVGKKDRMVAVMIGGNALSRPPGHPVFHPIYEAAAEMGLPLVLQSGAEAVADSGAPAVSGGPVSTYAEYHALGTTPLHSYVVNLIGQGVFEKFPTLRVLVVGGGSAWIPFVMWRFDREYRALRRETPWLRRHPSEYFRDHFRVTTYPIERAAPEGALGIALKSFGGVEEILCFASGYPNWDTDDIGRVNATLPAEWSARVRYDNAFEFFRWSTAAPLQEAVRNDALHMT